MTLLALVTDDVAAKFKTAAESGSIIDLGELTDAIEREGAANGLKLIVTAEHDPEGVYLPRVTIKNFRTHDELVLGGNVAPLKTPPRNHDVVVSEWLRAHRLTAAEAGEALINFRAERGQR